MGSAAVGVPGHLRRLDDHATAFTVLSRVFGERTETVDERGARAGRAVTDPGRAFFVAGLDREAAAAARAKGTA